MDHASSEFAVLLESMALRPEEASALEAGLREGPEDPRGHVQLVGYYGLAAFTSQDASHSLERHLLWLIQHAPTEPVLRTPWGTMLEALGAEAQEAWKAQLERHPDDAAVHAGAARFFTSRDVQLASALLARAKELAPEGDWEWRDRSRDEAQPLRPRSLDEREAELLAHTEPLRRFYSLTSVLMAALREEDLARLRRYGQEALDLAPRFPGDWNHGNALHQGHAALGLLALDRGDVEGAVGHLLSSAQTPGSPQLDSFGPDLTLAQRLLDQGQRDAVRRFLEQCRTFWKMGGAKLHFWLETLRTGQTPELLKRV